MKPIPNTGGRYFATRDGQIVGPRGKPLSVALTNRGYLVTSIRWKYGSRKKSYALVHRLVAAAFHGPCPDGLECNHKNGIKRDNRPENLEYVTKGQNEHHAHQIGLKSHKGSRNANAKLNERAVHECKKMYAAGVSQSKIAKRFGVSQSAVSLTINGRNWSSSP